MYSETKMCVTHLFLYFSIKLNTEHWVKMCYLSCLLFSYYDKTYLTEDTVPVVMESVLEKLDFR